MDLFHILQKLTRRAKNELHSTVRENHLNFQWEPLQQLPCIVLTDGADETLKLKLEQQKLENHEC